MLPILRMRIVLALLAVSLSAMMPLLSRAQDDPNETPLGDVARNLRKKTPPSQAVIDDDNLSKVMEQAESRHAVSSTLKFLMAGESKGFQIASPDVTCSLSFSASSKSLLSNQYAQMDLPPGEMLKLAGPATIEGDALTVSVFNGTAWHVSEVAVALTVVKKNTPAAVALNDGAPTLPGLSRMGLESEVRPEKKPDTTVIYRMRAAGSPSATTVFSAPLNLDLAPGDEWHWAIVQAKGFPPQGYSPAAPQVTTLSQDSMPARSTLSPILPPQDSPAASLPQDSQ